MFNREIAESREAHIYFETDKQAEQYLNWLIENYEEITSVSIDYLIEENGKMVIDPEVIAGAAGNYINFLTGSLYPTLESLKGLKENPEVYTFDEVKENFKNKIERLKDVRRKDE